MGHKRGFYFDPFKYHQCKSILIEIETKFTGVRTSKGLGVKSLAVNTDKRGMFKRTDTRKQQLTKARQNM
jgi:hypothetical protein